VVADLGATPLANSYLRPEQLGQMEPYYPLRVFVCERCWLAQVESVVSAETIFGHYDYFSSFSESLLARSKAFAAGAVTRVGLRPGDRVVEVASNDGYLLQYFRELGMDVFGIEPARNVAVDAIDRGVPTHVGFCGVSLGRELASQGIRARLVVANNVIAHVPDLHDVIGGLEALLAPGGLLSVELHHLLSLITHGQFDTIYHEHFQYFSLATIRRALAAHGLRVVDVEDVPAQGGSLRVYACRDEDRSWTESRRVADVLAEEDAAGLERIDTYRTFGERLAGVKLELLAFLVAAKQAGHTVVAYGAAAKGNTLLNYCGIDADLVSFAVDRSPHKQGLFLPGSRIPIHPPDRVRDAKPHYLLVLPWNLQDEIVSQMSYVRDWGGRFVVPIPTLHVLE
jgi:SAM-dependent methyltransferase